MIARSRLVALWITAACFGLALFAGAAAAQVTVRSSLAATRIPVGQTVDWVVTVEGAMGAEAPDIPDIDFARATARTIYGACGVKVWIFKGEILERAKVAEVAPAAPVRNA